jgi:hypothetical protein
MTFEERTVAKPMDTELAELARDLSARVAV